MLLQHATWYEVESYLKESTGIVIPIGSTEQHGPIGLIGTDALCAESVAQRMGDDTGTLIAPTISYTPAQFNLGFPGSVSISARTLIAVIIDIVQSLHSQGFTHIYFLNGHGANIAAVRSAIHDIYQQEGVDTPNLRLRSWWDYEAVNALRDEFYGVDEGMHATPSEIAITRVNYRQVEHVAAEHPPTELEPTFIDEHAGDQHAPAQRHRQQFPDGRVGSHSALATREHGIHLLDAAAKGAAEDYQRFLAEQSG